MRLFIFLLFPLTVSAELRPLYGEDSRVEFTDGTPLQQELADATAAQIMKSFLVKRGGKYRIDAPNLEEMSGVCDTENFRTQPAASVCSGTLVAPDLILTAAHCFQNESMCEGAHWVFGYYEKKNAKRYEVPAKNLYRCREVVYHAFDIAQGEDFALVKLDRPVKNRRPVKLRQSGTPELLTPLVLIGNPLGLPTKIAADAWVTRTDGNTLYTNVDAYTGSSGSGVFNDLTGELEGVLSHGKEDFEEDKAKECQRSKVYPMDSGAEAVLKIDPVREFLKTYR